MSSELSLNEIQKEWHGSWQSYVIGLLASLSLTIISFFLVITRFFAAPILIYVVIGLAIAQAVVQLLFFLHVGQEERPRWESISCGFTIFILLIIVIGSLWIMYDLNERMMPVEMETEMLHD